MTLSLMTPACNKPKSSAYQMAAAPRCPSHDGKGDARPTAVVGNRLLSAAQNYWLMAIAEGPLPAAYGEPLTVDNAPLSRSMVKTEISAQPAFAT